MTIQLRYQPFFKKIKKGFGMLSLDLEAGYTGVLSLLKLIDWNI